MGLSDFSTSICLSCEQRELELRIITVQQIMNYLSQTFHAAENDVKLLAKKSTVTSSSSKPNIQMRNGGKELIGELPDITHLVRDEARFEPGLSIFFSNFHT